MPKEADAREFYPLGAASTSLVIEYGRSAPYSVHGQLWRIGATGRRQTGLPGYRAAPRCLEAETSA